MRRNFDFLQQLRNTGISSRFADKPKLAFSGKRLPMDLNRLTHDETQLVERLYLVVGPQAPRSVVFAGVEHGNGCSTICVVVAQALAAQRDGSVCLVDANLRAPYLHQRFGASNLRGFAEYVLQSGSVHEFVNQIQGSNLWLLTAGFHLSEPHALFGSSHLREKMGELQSEFDHVLIDAPPVNLYPDAALLGQEADGVVLVVEANATRRETALKAKETLNTGNVKLLGAVLNKRTFDIPEAIYRRL